MTFALQLLNVGRSCRNSFTMTRSNACTSELPAREAGGGQAEDDHGVQQQEGHVRSAAAEERVGPEARALQDHAPQDDEDLRVA